MWEVVEDAEAIYHAARNEVDGAGVVPCLEFPDGVGAREAAFGGGDVDVDVGPFVGGFAILFERLGDGGGVCGEGGERG